MSIRCIRFSTTTLKSDGPCAPTRLPLTPPNDCRTLACAPRTESPLRPSSVRPGIPMYCRTDCACCRMPCATWPPYPATRRASRPIRSRPASDSEIPRNSPPSIWMSSCRAISPSGSPRSISACEIPVVIRSSREPPGVFAACRKTGESAVGMSAARLKRSARTCSGVAPESMYACGSAPIAMSWEQTWRICVMRSRSRVTIAWLTPDGMVSGIGDGTAVGTPASITPRTSSALMPLLMNAAGS